MVSSEATREKTCEEIRLDSAEGLDGEEPQRRQQMVAGGQSRQAHSPGPLRGVTWVRQGSLGATLSYGHCSSSRLFPGIYSRGSGL